MLISCAVAGHGAAIGVEFDARSPENSRACGGLAAGKRAYPQDQFGEMERLRAGLSALGIAIGVAAIVAVLGLSASSSAGLLAEINELGTNLLTVAPGQSLTGQTVQLPARHDLPHRPCHPG